MDALKSGDAGAAIEALRRACLKDSRDFLAHVYLGEAYVLARRPQDGVRVLRRAVHLQPESAQARYDLGIALERSQLLTESIAALEEVVAAEPEYPDARESLVRVRLAASQSKAPPANPNGNGSGGAPAARERAPSRMELLAETAPSPAAAEASSPGEPEPSASRPSPVSAARAALAAVRMTAASPLEQPAPAEAPSSLTQLREGLQAGNDPVMTGSTYFNAPPSPAGFRLNRVHFLAVLVVVSCGLLAWRLQVLKEERLAGPQPGRQRPAAGHGSTGAPVANTSPPGATSGATPRRGLIPVEDPKAFAASEARASRAICDEVRTVLDAWESQNRPPLAPDVLPGLRARAEEALTRSSTANRVAPTNKTAAKELDRATSVLIRVEEAQRTARINGPPPPKPVDKSREAQELADRAGALIDPVRARLDRWERQEKPRPIPEGEITKLGANLRQGLQLAEQAIDRDPRNPAGWIQEILALHLLGESNRARSTLDEARARFPQNRELGKLTDIVRAEG